MSFYLRSPLRCFPLLALLAVVFSAPVHAENDSFAAIVSDNAHPTVRNNSWEQKIVPLGHSGFVASWIEEDSDGSLNRNKILASVYTPDSGWTDPVQINVVPGKDSLGVKNLALYSSGNSVHVFWQQSSSQNADCWGGYKCWNTYYVILSASNPSPEPQLFYHANGVRDVGIPRVVFNSRGQGVALFEIKPDFPTRGSYYLGYTRIYTSILSGHSWQTPRLFQNAGNHIGVKEMLALNDNSILLIAEEATGYYYDYYGGVHSGSTSIVARQMTFTAYSNGTAETVTRSHSSVNSGSLLSKHPITILDAKVTDAGRVVLAYESLELFRNRLGGSQVRFRYYTASRSTSGSWTRPHLLENSASGDIRPSNLQLVSGTDDYGLTVWNQSCDLGRADHRVFCVYYSKENKDGTWTAPAELYSAKGQRYYSGTQLYGGTSNPNGKPTLLFIKPYSTNASLIARTFTPEDGFEEEHAIELVEPHRAILYGYELRRGQSADLQVVRSPSGLVGAAILHGVQPTGSTSFYRDMTAGVIIHPTSTEEDPEPTPTTAPTARPTTAPTARPTTAPTARPTTAPTARPTTAPTTAPTPAPTPTARVTPRPTQTATPPPTPSPSATPTPGAPVEHVIFASSGKYTATELNGTAGADSICRTLAQNAGLESAGSYRAILSDSRSHARDRIAISGPVKDIYGRTVANSEADFWDGTWQQSVRSSEKRGAPGSYAVWTGTRKDGSRATAASSSAHFCGDWTSRSGAVAIGIAYYSTGKHLDVYNGGAFYSSCSATMSLYCIASDNSSGSGTPPTPAATPTPTPAPVTEHTIFATSRAYTAVAIGGSTGADAKCRMLASNAGLDSPNSYKALLSTSRENARDRISINGTVKNVRGTVIANSESEFWSGSWRSPVYYSEKSLYPPSWIVWSGTRADGSKALHSSGYSSFCGDWTSSRGGVAVGKIYQKDQTALDVYRGGNPGSSCNASLAYYCISSN